MASFLLDTHALLWATAQPERLSPDVRKILDDPVERIWVSHSTLWELSIKTGIGKIVLPETFFAELPSLGYEMLPMTERHFVAYRRLPLLHRDPFDRMLVAQSMDENLPLITCDAEIRRYEGIVCLW